MDYIARTPAQLSQVLKNSRKRRKLSQEAIAAKVGLRQATVSAAEREAAASSIETLYKLCSALGLELVVRDATNGHPTAPRAREW